MLSKYILFSSRQCPKDEGQKFAEEKGSPSVHENDGKDPPQVMSSINFQTMRPMRRTYKVLDTRRKVSFRN